MPPCSTGQDLLGVVLRYTVLTALQDSQLAGYHQYQVQSHEDGSNAQAARSSFEPPLFLRCCTA